MDDDNDDNDDNDDQVWLERVFWRKPGTVLREGKRFRSSRRRMIVMIFWLQNSSARTGKCSKARLEQRRKRNLTLWVYRTRRTEFRLNLNLLHLHLPPQQLRTNLLRQLPPVVRLDRSPQPPFDPSQPSNQSLGNCLITTNMQNARRWIILQYLQWQPENNGIGKLYYSKA